MVAKVLQRYMHGGEDNRLCNITGACIGFVCIRGDGVHVGQGVVVCTVWRTNRCIHFARVCVGLVYYSKVFVSKRYIFLCSCPYCKEAGVVYAWCGGQRVLMK